MQTTAVKPLQQYEVSLASIQDADDIMSLLKEAASWIQEKQIQQWTYLLEGHRDHEIIEAIIHHETFVIKKDGQLMATFSLNYTQTEWDELHWGALNDNAAYLHKIAVSPKNIGSGIGREIIQWAKDYLKNKGVNYLRLNCVAHNEKLVKFYTKCGLENLGESHGHIIFQQSL